MLNPTSLMDTLQDLLSPSLSTREVMEKSTRAESHWPIMLLLKRNLVNSASSQLRTSFTRLLLLDHTSKKQTTSSGHSSSTLQSKDLKRRDIHITMVVSGVTEKKKSMNSWKECSEWNWLFPCFDKNHYIYSIICLFFIIHF